MAVDTKAKILSAIGVRRLPFILRRFSPDPDSTIGDLDRQHLVGGYMGIPVTPDEPSEPSEIKKVNHLGISLGIGI